MFVHFIKRVVDHLCQSFNVGNAASGNALGADLIQNKKRIKITEVSFRHII